MNSPLWLRKFRAIVSIRSREHAILVWLSLVKEEVGKGEDFFLYGVFRGNETFFHDVLLP